MGVMYVRGIQGSAIWFYIYCTNLRIALNLRQIISLTHKLAGAGFMKIKQVSVKYFRSIYDQKIKIGDLNIISGLNDSGKSNFLKALTLFF